MAEFDWKKIVGTVAPAVASAFGTPAMGVAVAALSQVIFGRTDADAADVARSIADGQLTGDQLVAIRQADNDFKIKMGQMGLDLQKLEADTEQAYLKDVQDARARQVATRDFMPQIIFFLFLAIYVAEVAMFFYGQMPTDEYVRALMTRAFGTVEAGVVGAVAYFIGSSRGSKQSGDAVRKIAEQSTKP